MSETSTCGLCGEPMPPGEEMFAYHGFSGPCPKPPAPGASSALTSSLTVPRDPDAGRIEKERLKAYQEGWNAAHERARCGHVRANYLDPDYGTPAYRGREACEACALQDRVVAAEERAERAKRNRCCVCGAKITDYPGGCPGCGARQCCHPCCDRANAEQRAESAERRLTAVVEAVERYRDEYDNPVPDYGLRHLLRTRLFAALGAAKGEG